jgi:purine catabolism regulator
MLLREVFELPILRDAGIRLVSGSDLDRQVRWAHTGEIPDIARYLSGGEVLLTAATGIGSSEEERRRYIQELVAADAVAIVFELGRRFKKIPVEMIDEASGTDLVLAELTREVPFVEVTHAVHTRLLNEQHQAQDRAIQIGDGFARLVLEGPPVPGLMQFLADELRNPVILEDGARHVLAVGTYRETAAPLLRRWAVHSRQGHQGADVGVLVAESEPRCAWTSIAFRGQVWGRLHVLEVDTPLDLVTDLALGRAASNIAMYLLAERDAYLSETAERSLVGEIARGDASSAEDFMARANGLGVDFDGSVLALCIGASGAPRREEAPDVDEAMVREALRSIGWPSLVGSLAEGIVVVASARPEPGIQEALSQLGGRLEERGVDFHIGVGRTAKTSRLQQAIAEASTAHDLGPTLGAAHHHHYDDLALHRLLAPLLQVGPELANFVEGELGPLLRYDEEHNSELLRTLDAYLQSNGSKAAAADALFLQRRSVYYRLSRIEALLNRSIDNSDNRARLYIALRARELLEARGLSQ